MRSNLTASIPPMTPSMDVPSPRAAVRRLFSGSLGVGGCTAFLILFSPLIDGGTTQVPVLLMRLAVIGTLAMWLLQQIKAGAVHVPYGGLGPPAAAFLGWAALSLVWSPYKTASLQWLLTLLLYAGVFVIAAVSVKADAHQWVVVGLLLGIGAIEGIWGLVQFMWLGRPRATGTFFNPNFFASYEGAMLLLSLGILAYASGREAMPVRRLFLWIHAAIAAAAFVAAQSRGALCALIAAAFVVGVLRFGKIAVAVVLAVVVLGTLTPNPLRQRITDVSAGDPYAYTRLDIWTNSLSRAVDHPFGIGLGLYKYGSFHDRFPIETTIVHYRKRPESAHNEYLQLLDEVGVIGTGLFLIGLGRWLWQARLAWSSPRSSAGQGLLLGLVGAVILLLLHAGVDSVFHEPALVVVLLVCGAVVHRMYASAHSEALCTKAIRFRYGWGHAAIVMSLGLLLSLLSLQQAAAWYAHELGRKEASEARHTSAMHWYQRASAIDPGTTGYHDSIARAAVQLFRESGDAQWLVTASVEESVARDLNRLDARFPYRLGTIYALMADQPEFRQQKAALLAHASTSYGEAIEADPFSPFSYFELAQLHAAQGRTENAIALLQTVKRYEPNYLPGRALLAHLSLTQGLPGDYHRELQDLRTLKTVYEPQVVDELDRQFIDADLSPLARAVGMKTHQ